MSYPVPAPGVLTISAYQPGAAGAPGVTEPLRLASNEAATGPSPLALEAAKAAAADARRYPDPFCTRLRAAIGSRYGQHPDQIVCGSGSEALIHIAMRCYVTAGDEVIIPLRAFALGRIAAASCGATIVGVEEDANLETDVGAIASAVTERTKVVYIANPNNPTGRLIPAADIRRLRQILPSRVLLMLDAAYRDYVIDPSYSPGDELVGDDRGNVLVFGTFSKSYALAGLRVGWVYAPREIVSVINRVRPAFAVSSPAIAAATAALGDADHMRREVELVVSMRDWLADELRKLGLGVGPSHGNFVLAEIPPEMGTAADINAGMISRGIFLRPALNYVLPQALRITIGQASEMQRVVDAFRELFGQAQASAA